LADPSFENPSFADPLMAACWEATDELMPSGD
jgi:hypothetical protein